MTATTSTRWRNTAQIVAICLAGALFFATFWYRATYHVFPGTHEAEYWIDHVPEYMRFYSDNLASS